MSELPASWTVSTVGELFVTVGGGTPSTAKPDHWRGSIPWISSADIDDEHRLSISRFISEGAITDSATNLVPAGSVIVVTRVGLGKVAIASSALCFSQDNQALLINPKHFDPNYVLHYMSTAVRNFKHISRGTTISGVTKKQLLETEFVLPPRPEQTRIVAEIEKQFTRLDAATAALKRVQANLKRYRASVLKAACEGRLVSTEAELARKEGRDYEPADKLLERILRERRARWEAEALAKMIASGKTAQDDSWKRKYKEPSAPDTSVLPSLPEGWCWASVEQLSWRVQYGTSAKCKDSGEIAVIRMGNIHPGGLSLRAADLKFLPNAHPEFPELFLSDGDILFNRTNSAELVGKTAVFSGFSGSYSFASYLIRVSVLDGCNPHFVSAYINSTFGREWIRRVVNQQVGQANVNGSKLQALTIPLTPKSEQNRIVGRLLKSEAYISRTLLAVASQIKRCDALRRSILQTAFSGRLVPQDPSDEPATTLLERIRVERASGSNGKPTKPSKKDPAYA